jgi:DNA-binding NarL/FixJ family response regulator
MEKENESYTVLIADDHDIVCAGVKSILRQYTKIGSIDQVMSYSHLMEHINDGHYDILILDLNLGDHNGIHIIRELTDEYPSMKILVLSMYPEDPYAIQCIHEGAGGYVNKTKVLTELIPALEKIEKGKIYLSAQYEDNLLYGTELSKKKRSSLTQLTQREFEIYNLIVSGISFREIADQLNISPKTVSAHHTNILQKLSLSNLNQLIHFSLQH